MKNILMLTCLVIAINCVLGQTTKDTAKKILPLNSSLGLELINVKADVVDHNGKEGILISKIEGEIKGETLVVIQRLILKMVLSK